MPDNLQKISFPDKQTSFLGRNGTGKCIGVELFRASPESQTISIMPVTSKNETGRCKIIIPVAAVPEIIVALKSLHSPSDNSQPDSPQTIKVHTIINFYDGIADEVTTTTDHAEADAIINRFLKEHGWTSLEEFEKEGSSLDKHYIEHDVTDLKTSKTAYVNA
jgi:hypothetical protein